MSVVERSAVELNERVSAVKNPKGAGRKPAADPVIMKHVGLTQSGWDFLEKLLPGAKASAQIVELLDRSRCFLPEGKPPQVHQPGKVRRTSALARYAAREGLDEAAVFNRAWEALQRELEQGETE